MSFWGQYEWGRVAHGPNLSELSEQYTLKNIILSSTWGFHDQTYSSIGGRGDVFLRDGHPKGVGTGVMLGVGMVVSEDVVDERGRCSDKYTVEFCGCHRQDD